MSVPEVGFDSVRFKVTTESQPLYDPFGMVQVAVLLLLVYVLPSIQVKLLHAL